MPPHPHPLAHHVRPAPVRRALFVGRRPDHPDPPHRGGLAPAPRPHRRPARRGGVPRPRRRARGAICRQTGVTMRASRLLALVVVGALAAAACGTAQPPKAATGTATATAADQMQPGAVAMTLESAHPYQPVPPPGGGTDDYHCTLVDPGLKADSMIVASHF